MNKEKGYGKYFKFGRLSFYIAGRKDKKSWFRIRRRNNSILFQLEIFKNNFVW